MPSSGVHQRGRWWLSAVAAVSVLGAGDAGAQQASKQDDAALIEEGRRLFLEETFGGNGRTCGTCHPPENNFTLTPDFIASLSGSDPLFVAIGQLDPLEENRLIRRHGLFVENVDGFDQPGVLRGVPHTLGLRTSIGPPSGFSHGHATGWSGDGAANAGTLRDFATGAVIQHFTRTLNREEGVDFRLPTRDELDALEAFQLSLGRQEEVNIIPGDTKALVFTDDVVELGRELFHEAEARGGGTRSCATCHENAGANTPDGINGNFDTGTALLPNAPACLSSSTAPGDGGLGPDPVESVDRRDLCGGTGQPGDLVFQGDGTFNTPPLIEAADTPPFFHNNTAATLEEAIRFYTTDTFQNSDAGGFGGAFVLGPEEVDAIAALLRALNVLENIRSAIAAIDGAATVFEGDRAEEELHIAVANTEDAAQVLAGSPVELFPGLGVAALIDEALALERAALDQGLDAGFLADAALALEGASSAMIASGSYP